MKKKEPSSHSFVNLRTLMGLGLCLFGFAITLFSTGILSGGKGAEKTGPQQDRPGTQKPDMVKMVGPVSQDLDLNALRYIPPTPKEEERRLTRHGWKMDPPKNPGVANFLDLSWVLNPAAPTPLIPAPSVTFDGITSAVSGCGCLPPDTDGDVGPNHYVQSVNSGIQVFNKTTGAALTSFTTYNSFFSALGTGNPCGNSNNDGDGVVIYDSQADRWVVTDFAFPAFPGTSFYQCIGVSKTSSPVSGGWWLYAIQVDPSNPSYFGDYPKIAAWSDGYYQTMNLFTTSNTFNGVRVYAFNRTSMLSGGPANAIGFTIDPATLGNSYSLLPATYRFGAPPAGAAEYLLSVDSTDNSVQNTAVYAWRFHADFVTPANSTLGTGASHAPNTTITVPPFYSAVENTGANATTDEVPQTGTTRRLDTLGDKLMYPLYYQNRGGTESLWAVQTVNTGSNAAGFTNPTGVLWYQFNVTGGVLPSGPAQTQTFTNSNDGLWRFMPSLALDVQGNMAIGYSMSSSTINPAIRYAGRLAGDAANSLAQGENTLIQGAGHQTFTTPRWGDYSATGVDVSDSCTFYHTNEYYSTTSASAWRTRVGAFKFATCTAASPTPTPTATATATPTATATATATPTATPAAPTLVSAASRMTHGGGAGTFSVPLPLSGSSGVEGRSDGSGNYTIVLTFNTPINGGSASVTNHTSNCDNSIPVGSGSVSSVAFSGADMIVSLSGVTDQQVLTVSATGVTGTNGGTGGSGSVQAGFLWGNVNADRTVNAGDTLLVRDNAGATLDNTNFQYDVNVDGAVNVGDTTTVRNNSSNCIPP